MKLVDKYGRIHDYLRLSVTDKCNLNCLYCNPARQKVEKLSKAEILSYDELFRLLKIFLSEFGIRKIRLTGGEPLVRKDITKLFYSLSELKNKYDFEFALTTNGIFLGQFLQDLKSSGLNKLNISLDSLKKETFHFLNGSNSLDSVLSSIRKAEEMAFAGIKLNMVVIKDVNSTEIIDFVNFVKNRDITLRFIEYMPFGNNGWDTNAFVKSEEIKNRIEQCFDLEKDTSDPLQVADIYKLKYFRGKVGFISPISNHFCGNCNRLRIKADGRLKLCLFTNLNDEIDLKKSLRDGSLDDGAIANLIFDSLQHKEKEHPPVDELLNLDSNNMLNIGG